MATRQPSACGNWAWAAGAMRQKAGALVGRMLARVMAATRPPWGCSPPGSVACGVQLTPSQVPRLDWIPNKPKHNSRARLRYLANTAPSQKACASAKESNTQTRPWWLALGRKLKPPAWPLPMILAKRNPGTSPRLLAPCAMRNQPHNRCSLSKSTIATTTVAPAGMEESCGAGTDFLPAEKTQPFVLTLGWSSTSLAGAGSAGLASSG